MELDEIKRYVQEILVLEFADRDHEIQINVGRVKTDMAARGITISTITLNQLAEFFLGEFRARVDLIANHAIGKIGILRQHQENDVTIPGVALYTQIAAEQFKLIDQAYEGSASTILPSLLSNMPVQIRELLTKRMTDYMWKNELIVEFEYKASTPSDSQKDVLLLRPAFCGVGIDLKVLWDRYMK